MTKPPGVSEGLRQASHEIGIRSMDTIPEFLVQRYAHLLPISDTRYETANALSEEFAMLANVLEQLLPSSREKAIAHTSLQQAYWAALESLRLYDVTPPASS